MMVELLNFRSIKISLRWQISEIWKTLRVDSEDLIGIFPSPRAYIEEERSELSQEYEEILF